MANSMELRFFSAAQNEAFARMVVSAFLVQINPTLSEISEIRTAVSEAVTNAVVHAYDAQTDGLIVLRTEILDEQIMIEIEDFGCGIIDVQEAMQPFYTSHPEQERTGIGFSLMQSFMDEVVVQSSPGMGTLVKMKKLISDTSA